jgi:two-component system, sensor histidine kinase and response regulator
MEDKRDILKKPYKILIVDDDPFVIKTLERILFKKNFLFHSVTSGEKALQVICDINPDIVLLDVLMSDIDGYDVCKKLKKLPGGEHIPVIFLTGNTGIDEVVKGFKAGAVDYIVKPFNTAELVARLETHLELKRSREEIKQMDLLKTKFFSIMTQDIKNSIIGLKGVASFLMHELTDVEPENNEPLKLSKILLNDSTELYQLLENLIEWASIELGQKKIITEEIITESFIREIIFSHESLINQKEIYVEVICPQNFKVRLQTSHFKSILHRLISNALKYSNKGGKISVSFSYSENMNTFIVEDFGVGMPEDVAENVFRLDTPHPKTIGTNGEKGTGVGLIICKTLADRINGTISIETQKSKGTRVVLKALEPLES